MQAVTPQEAQNKPKSTLVHEVVMWSKNATDAYDFIRSLGYTQVPGSYGGRVEWRKTPQQDEVERLGRAIHDRELVDEAKVAAAAEARREALEAVIDALQLRDYGYRGDNDYPSPILIPVDKRPGHERLWADIQTALDVREERKLAEQRAKTEEKVAALAKRYNGGLIDGAVLRDLLNSEDRAWVHHPYVSPFAAGASSHHGAAPKVPERREPVTLSDYDRELLESIKSMATLGERLGVQPSDSTAFAETVDKLGAVPTVEPQGAEEVLEQLLGLLEEGAVIANDVGIHADRVSRLKSAGYVVAAVRLPTLRKNAGLPKKKPTKKSEDKK